jgi:hypothetical protein
MNKTIVAIEIFFCLLLFPLSNKQEVNSPAVSNREEYKLERSACYSRPANQVQSCLRDPSTKQY